MEMSLKIALISLSFSLVALTWNIARDIFLDRIKLNLRMFMGENIADDKGKPRAISEGAIINSHGSNRTVLGEKIFFQITNVGRRDIEIDHIKAEYVSSGGFGIFP